jgi:hypothetical protein
MHESHPTGYEQVDQDPDLTPAQQAMRELCHQIFLLKPERLINMYWDIDITEDAASIKTYLENSRAGVLLLKDGSSLSAPTISERRPDIGLTVNPDHLKKVTIRAWEWSHQKMRSKPSDSVLGGFDVKVFDGETDWSHELDFIFWYVDEAGTRAFQKISISSGSLSAGFKPIVSRDVYASAYAEMGYGGHNQVADYDMTDEDVLGLVQYAHELCAPKLPNHN